MCYYKSSKSVDTVIFVTSISFGFSPLDVFALVFSVVEDFAGLSSKSSEGKS